MHHPSVDIQDKSVPGVSVVHDKAAIHGRLREVCRRINRSSVAAGRHSGRNVTRCHFAPFLFWWLEM